MDSQIIFRFIFLFLVLISGPLVIFLLAFGKNKYN